MAHLGTKISQQTWMPSRRTGTRNRGTSRGMVGTQLRAGGQNSTHIEAGKLYKEDCKEDLSRICPRLAEALARGTRAERQVVEINHRLVNVLQMVVASLGRQRRMQADPAVREEIDELASRVQAAASLHRHMLPPRKPTPVDLSELLKEMALAFSGVTGLVCEADVEPVDVPGQVAMVLATVVNELAWNAYKHAYSDAGSGVVQIVCRLDADSRLRLSVADRGCGLPTDFDPCTSSSVGLMSVSATVQDLGGELRIESERGARFTLLLPIPGV